MLKGGNFISLCVYLYIYLQYLLIENLFFHIIMIREYIVLKSKV